MKKRKRLIMSCLFALLCTGMAQAEDYVYATTTVQQSGTTVTDDGTANFDITSNDGATMYFDGDNAVMKIGEVIVAKVPVDATNDGELVGQPVSSSSELTGYTYTTPTGYSGYGTLYSPFRITVLSTTGCSVYVPKLSTDGGTVLLNISNKVGTDTAIEPWTPLVIKGSANTKYKFGVSPSTTATTLAKESSFAGSTLLISKPSTVVTMFTLGIGANSKKVGFYKNTTATQIPASKAYFWTSESLAKSGLAFGDIDNPTDIDNVDATETPAAKDGKYIINGRIVVLKGDKMYNLNGQEVK